MGATGFAAIGAAVTGRKRFRRWARARAARLFDAAWTCATTTDRSGGAFFASTTAVREGFEDVIDGLSVRSRWMKKAAAMPKMIGTASIDSLLVHERTLLVRQVPLAITQS